MNAMRMIAVVLVIAGAVGIYGNVTHTKYDYTDHPDTVDVAIEKKQTIQAPLWGGVVVIIIGGMLFFATRRRS